MEINQHANMDAEMARLLGEAAPVAKPEKGGFESVPDGLYVAKVSDVRIAPSEKSGARSVFRMEFEVLAPETVADATRKLHKTVGRKVSMFSTLIDAKGEINARNIGNALWAYEELGVPVEGGGGAGQLVTRAAEVVGVACLIRVKKSAKSDFVNVDIERKATQADLPGLAVAAAAAHRVAGEAAAGPSASVADSDQTPF
jgi:hypothetical protein